MAVVVEVELEQRIAELVAARRPVLEQLVAEAVDRELVTLVEAELDAALERLASRNGATVSHARQLPTAELCSRCGERPALHGRRYCQTCRTARVRERRSQPANTGDDGPRTGSGA